MIKQYLKAIVVLLLIGNLSSCVVLKRTFGKKKRKAGTSVTIIPAVIDSAKATGEIPVIPLTAEKQKLINAVLPYWKTPDDFNRFSAKIKMHYEGKGDKQDITANVRVLKDSVIWVQVTATFLSVQVARIYITPDSFKLINYLERTALLMSLDDAQKILPVPVDFNVLQNLILGKALQSEGKIVDAINMGETVSLQTATENILQLLTYNKVDSTLTALQMNSINDENIAGDMQYTRYEKIGARHFSMDRNFHIQNAGEQYILEMNFTHAAFDEALDFPFSIPKNYERK